MPSLWIVDPSGKTQSTPCDCDAPATPRDVFPRRVLRCRMSDDALLTMLTNAVKHLRSETDLTMDEVIGLQRLPDAARTPDVCYALGVIEGAATALRATPREMLEDHDLLTAPKRT